MNKQLFFDCLGHREPLIDPYYCSEELIISRASGAQPTREMLLWGGVRDRLTAADVAKKDGDDDGFARHARELDRLLLQPSANFLEFTSFFPALDVSYSIYRKLPEHSRLDFLSRAMVEYIEKRHRVYMSHGYTPVTIQVRRDFEKHKTGGSSARRKLDALLPAAGFEKAANLDDFRATNSFIHADGALYNQCEYWLRALGMKFEWRATHQDKLPDVVINKHGRIFVVECKHMKEVGGGQDKQLTELIDLIRYQEPDFDRGQGFDISYVAFLDGVLFNELVQPSAAKMRRQKFDIEDFLTRNPDNYFVNTWGFNQLIG